MSLVKNRLSKQGPTDWRDSRVKYLAQYINGYAFKPEDWSNIGKPILRIQNLTDPDAAFNRFEGEIPDVYLIRDGDILISWSASLGVYVWKGEDAWLNQHIFKVIVNEEIIGRGYFIWLARWFIKELEQRVHGSTMQHLTRDAFGTYPVKLPPISEQQKITEFLNQEITRIDQLINAKRNLLTALFEKRQAITMRSLKHGISGEYDVTEAEVEWIGNIPEHWELEYARWLFHEVDERSTTGEEELLSVSHITGVTPRSEKDVNMFQAESLEGYKVCQPGDLVINTLWAWMGAMGVAFQEGIVSPSYHVYRQNGDYAPRYIDYLVRLPNFAKEVTRYSKGVWSSRLRLYPDEFFKIVLPVPPIEEQREIVAYLDEEIAKLDELSQAVEETIELLQERRSALIAAAVTGKIRVTE